MEKLRVELEKFGKIESICQSVYNYEFKVTKGFSGKINDTINLLKICKQEAEQYSIVKKCVTDKNLFHLILSKRND
jgi:hypothetical protein